MKKFNQLLMVVIIITFASCANYTYIGGGTITSKELKGIKIYKTGYVETYNQKAFDLVLAKQRDYIKPQQTNDSLNRTPINTVYAELFSLFSEYLDKEYKKAIKEMGLSVFDWKREFVKLEYYGWDQMPKTSNEMALQFDSYMAAVAKELNKAAVAANVSFVGVETPGFRAMFIDKMIKSFLGEYTEKEAKAVIKKK